MSADRRPRWRTYGPNSSDQMALVSMRDKQPFRAVWRIRLTQIVGGKTWSLSFVRHLTEQPELTEAGRAYVTSKEESR